MISTITIAGIVSKITAGNNLANIVVDAVIKTCDIEVNSIVKFCNIEVNSTFEFYNTVSVVMIFCNNRQHGTGKLLTD